MGGFRMDEIMVGTHRFADSEDERPMLFHLSWGHPRPAIFYNPFSPEFLCARARGVITVDGLVHKADCSGNLKLLYFSGGKIRYELDFSDDQGKAYHYLGEKVNIRPWNLHRSHTTCYGTITEHDTGKVVSNSVIRFPLSELPAFLKSFRLLPSGEKNEGSLHDDKSAASFDSRSILTEKEGRILTAMAEGIIPSGGSFEYGAEALAARWLPRTDYILQRMPQLTRLFFRAGLHIFDRLLPVLYMKRPRPLSELDATVCTQIFSRMEHAAFPGALAVMVVKLMVLPAFYGLPEVKAAIGYKERFENPAFERVKH